MGVCDTLLEDLHSRDIILTVVPSVQKKKIPYELRQLSGHFFLAPREVGASIILPVFGSAVVALTCMSNIYRKERQDHAMDLKTLAP